MPIGEARRKANERYNAKAYERNQGARSQRTQGRIAGARGTAEREPERVINRAIDTQLERDNRTATEIIEQDYLPLEQTIVNQFRNEGTSDEEILQFLREFS